MDQLRKIFETNQGTFMGDHKSALFFYAAYLLALQNINDPEVKILSFEQFIDKNYTKKDYYLPDYEDTTIR